MTMFEIVKSLTLSTRELCITHCEGRVTTQKQPVLLDTLKLAVRVAAMPFNSGMTAMVGA